MVALLLGPAFLAMPAQAQETAKPFELSDPAGDVRVQAFLPLPGPPLPQSALTDAYDLRALIASETPMDVNFEIRFADLGGVKSVFPATIDNLRLTFESSAGVQYSLNTFGPGQLEFLSRAGGTSLFCVGQTAKCTFEVRPQYDIGGDAVRMRIPKGLFLGRSADGSIFSEEANAKPFGAGSGLKNWKLVASETAVVGAPSLMDDLQADTLFPLSFGVPNQELVLRRLASTKAPSGNDDVGPVRAYPDRLPFAATIGQPTPLVLVVENHATTKRLVNLSAVFSDPKQESKFGLRMPRAIEVPAGQARNLTVIIDASQSLARRESAAVVFAAQALGESSLGAHQVTLVATEGMGPKNAKLFAHAANLPPPAGRSCTPVDACFRTFFWLTSDEQDPAATADPRAELYPFPGTFSSGRVTNVNLVTDTPLGQRIRFEDGAPVNAKFMFTARADFTAKITVVLSTVSFSCNVSCRDDVAIGTASVERAIGPSSTPIELPIPVDARIQTVGPDKFLRLYIEIASSDPRHVASTLGLAFHAAQSGIDLPLVEDLSTPDVGSHLRFYVDEAQEFVNPGRTRLFKVRLANEGSEPDTVEVRLNATQGWNGQLKPASRFILQPGESVGLGAFLTAPGDAKEATLGNLTLNATSALMPPTWSQLRLRAIVTSGVDIADQAAPFQADEDTQKRVALNQAKESPGVSSAFVSVALLALAALARRRA